MFRGFKALKQTVKLHYKLGNHKEMMEAYREMLTYIKSAVTRNYSEKCINKILDFVSSSQNLELLQEFYQTTLQALEEAKNEVRKNSLCLNHAEAQRHQSRQAMALKFNSDVSDCPNSEGFAPGLFLISLVDIRTPSPAPQRILLEVQPPTLPQSPDCFWAVEKFPACD